MNLRKRSSIFFATIAALGLFAVSQPARAQPAQAYPATLITTNATQLTNAFLHASTNNYGQTVNAPLVTFRCDEYDYAGISITQSATAATTGTGTYVVQMSEDGGVTYETNPTNQLAAALNGTNAVNTRFTLDLHGVDHFRIYQTWNTNASADITNVVFKVRLKSPKYGAKQATQ